MVLCSGTDANGADSVTAVSAATGHLLWSAAADVGNPNNGAGPSLIFADTAVYALTGLPGSGVAVGVGGGRGAGWRHRDPSLECPGRSTRWCAQRLAGAHGLSPVRDSYGLDPAAVAPLAAGD
jgi:hypothetical protein